MGIKEEQEWLQDLIIDEFADITGLVSGVDSDTVVYQKNGAKLFVKVCDKLKLRANYVTGMALIDDFTHHFLEFLKKRNAEREIFMDRLNQFIYEKSGRIHDSREILFNGRLPHSDDPVQHKREEIAYDLKLGNVKQAIRNEYRFYRESYAFDRAKTLDELVTAMFGKRFLLG